MKRIILFTFAILSVVLNSNAGFVNYGVAYYWECSFAPDAYTGQMQFLRGDGESRINVVPDKDNPSYVVDGNSEYRLKYYGEKEGWSVYKTQFPAIEFWTNNKYVMKVSYMGGRIIYMARYNPRKGVISGNQSDINRYDHNRGGSSSGGSRGSGSSEIRCSGCHGSGKCTGCAGRGEYRGEGYYGTQWFDCPVCGGTGNCKVCHGSGVIR